MIRYASITGTGICDENDDRIMVNGKIISSGCDEGESSDYLLAIVCDGVGTHSFGGEAADVTLKSFISLVGKPLSQEEIENAIAEANNLVLERQLADMARKKMSTTIAGLFISENSFIAFNVGDSKVCRFRVPYLAQLSTDHTQAQEGIRLGLFDESDEEYVESRNVITRYIGDKQRCRPSFFARSHEELSNSIFLLCSDGLTDTANIEEIESILEESVELSGKCEKLFDLAMKSGSLDNISIILTEVV